MDSNKTSNLKTRDGTQQRSPSCSSASCPNPPTSTFPLKSETNKLQDRHTNRRPRAPTAVCHSSPFADQGGREGHPSLTPCRRRSSCWSCAIRELSDGNAGVPGTLGNSILLLSLDVLQDSILTPSCFSNNCCLPRLKSAQIHTTSNWLALQPWKSRRKGRVRHHAARSKH